MSVMRDYTTSLKPIVRWVGGKRDLARMLSDIAYASLQRTGGHYHEPFLGGGAVAFDLGLPEMVLSDLCAPLIDTYRAIQRWPRDVAWMLDVYRNRGCDADVYYRVRDEAPTSRVERAARFLYLNTLCYNGVYRENASGKYNVPYGRRAGGATPNFLSVDDLIAFQKLTVTASFAATDFRESLAAVGAGDFVYADPPYYAVFDKYQKGGFSDGDHLDLATALRDTYDRGAEILTTNADVPCVRELYDWAFVVPTVENRRVSQTKAGRAKAACLLITTVPDLLPPSFGAQ